MSSEPLTRDDLDPPVEADDPLAGLGDPDDLDDAYEDPADYDELALDDEPYQPGDYLPGTFDAADADPGDEPVLLVWPAEEYEQVDQRWPEVLEPIGADSWEEYRRYHQALITRWTRRGMPLSLVTGTADGFADWLDEQGADPVSADLVGLAEGYGRQLADQVGAVELPPAGTDPCWCGSAVSYRDCCAPLSPG